MVVPPLPKGGCGVDERTVDQHQLWVVAFGQLDGRLVDVSTTSTDEQRSTEWMRFQSLADFLDPVDSTRTIEGYPAPMRAIVTARAAGDWQPRVAQPA